MTKISRIKFKDLGTNPETGKQRRLYVGYMTEAEYINHIMGAAADGNADLDDGAAPEHTSDVQADLWDEMTAHLQTPKDEGYGQN